MSKLEEYRDTSKLRDYFRDKLDLDEEEFDQRFRMYLELFPFIALDFRLKNDCHSIHRAAKLDVRALNQDIQITGAITSTPEKESSYSKKAEEYRILLEEVIGRLETQEVEINLDG